MRPITAAIAAAAATAIVVSGSFAIAAIPNSSSKVITGCFLKTSGTLRVIDKQAGKACKTTETELFWNQQGPKGDIGLTGPAGPKGDAGSNGAAGAPGSPGAPGARGLGLVPISARIPWPLQVAEESARQPLFSSSLVTISGTCVGVASSAGVEALTNLWITTAGDAQYSENIPSAVQMQNLGGTESLVNSTSIQVVGILGGVFAHLNGKYDFTVNGTDAVLGPWAVTLQVLANTSVRGICEFVGNAIPSSNLG